MVSLHIDKWQVGTCPSDAEGCITDTSVYPPSEMRTWKSWPLINFVLLAGVFLSNLSSCKKSPKFLRAALWSHALQTGQEAKSFLYLGKWRNWAFTETKAHKSNAMLSRMNVRTRIMKFRIHGHLEVFCWFRLLYLSIFNRWIIQKTLLK